MTVQVLGLSGAIPAPPPQVRSEADLRKLVDSVNRIRGLLINLVDEIKDHETRITALE